MRPVEEAAPEGGVLRHRQAGLHGVGVPNKVALLADARIRGTAVKADLPCLGRQEAGQRAQQRSLACPVRPRHQQRLPGRHGK